MILESHIYFKTSIQKKHVICQTVTVLFFFLFFFFEKGPFQGIYFHKIGPYKDIYFNFSYGLIKGILFSQV